MQEIPIIANNIYEKFAPPDSIITRYIIYAQSVPPYFGIIIGITLGILIVLIAYARFPRKRLTDDDKRELKEKGLTYFASEEEVRAIKKNQNIELIEPRFLVHQEYLPLISGSPDDMSKKFIKSRLRREDLTQDIYTVHIHRITEPQTENLRKRKWKSVTLLAQYEEPFPIIVKNKVTYNCVYKANKENPNEKKKRRFGNYSLINSIADRLRIRKEKR